METNPPNPFKGLRPYKQEDRHRLFGRDRDLILMKDRIFSGAYYPAVCRLRRRQNFLPERQ
jgi:hypothetical protein